MKKIRAALLALAVILATSVCAMAASPGIVTSGDYDYAIDGETAVIVKYNGDATAVRIPSEIDGHPVAEVGAEAFRYRKLTSVSLPDGVRTIGRQAFEYCEITEALQLPEGVVISNDVFSYAKLPAAVVIPAGAEVEECAFSYCEGVNRIVLGSGATIHGRAFGYCDALKVAVCASGVRLEARAFEHCRKMTQAILCGDVEAEDGAFSDCGALEVTESEAGEFDALEQAVLDGSLGGEETTPYEAEERSLEIRNSPAALDGVTVALDQARAIRDPKTGSFTYTFAGTLENNTDEGIMQVIYTFALIDENGEEFRSFSEIYDGEDAAMPPHASAAFTHDGIKWGKQSVPAAVEIGVSSVKTEAELPPAHVPRKGEYLYQAVDDEKLANIREEKPAELSFHVDQGGYGRTAAFEAGEALDRAVELFCDIRIGEESGEWVTDNYNWIGFTWEDGTHSGVSLNLNNLEYSIHSTLHTYKLENLGAFWDYCAEYLEEDG